MNTLPSAPKPTLRQRKLTAWIVLALNAGSTLLFVTLILSKGPPSYRERWIYLWPLISILGCTFSARSLKRSYRIEPENFSGFWHLSIVDFYAVTLFAALMMAAVRAAWPGNFLPAGVVTSLCFSFAYLICLLLTARVGTSGVPQKYIRAVSFLLIALGWMAIGSIGVVCIILTLMGEFSRIGEFVLHIVGVKRDDFLTEGIFVAIRVGLIGLPLARMLNRRFQPPSTDEI